MKDEKKTKAQLIADIAALRQEVATLKAPEKQHRQTEEALLESEQRFREFTNLLPQIVFEADLEGRIAFMNRSGYELFGYSDESLQKLPNYLQLLIPEDRNRVKENLGQFTGGKKTGINEYMALRKDGSTFPVLSYSSLVFHDEKPVGVRGIGIDVTEYRQAEKALRESEQRFRELADLLPQIVFEITLDGNLTFTNRCGFETFGYTQEDVDNGLNNLQLFVPEEHDRIKENTQRIFHGEKIFGLDYTARRKDGSIFPVIIYSSLIIQEGKPVGLRGIVVDITERRQAEQKQLVVYRIATATNTAENLSELFKSIRKELGTIVDTTNFYIALYDKKSDTISLPYMLDDKDEFTSFPAGKTLTSYVIKKGEPLLATEEVIAKLVRAGEVKTIGTSAKVWLGVPLKIGKEVIGAMAIQSYTDASAYSEKDLEVLQFASGQIAIAIERKRGEEKLRASESRYRLLVENLPQKIFLKDRDSVYVSCNEHYAQDLKIKPREISGKTDYDFYPKELAEKYRADDQRIMESGKTEEIEERYVQRGKEVFVHTAKTLVRNEQGHVSGILGIFWDITERKQAEQALKESKDMLSALLNATDDAAFLADNKGNILIRNENFAKRFGKGADELVGSNSLSIIPPELAKKRRKMTDKILASGKALDFEDERDGRIFHTSCYPICNERGEVEKVAVFSRDITKERQAEEALRESEEQYRATIDSMADMIHLIDNDLRIVLVNEAFKKKAKEVGLETKIVGRKIFDVLSFLPKRVRDEYQYIFETGKNLVTEERTTIAGKEYITETRRIPVFENEKVARIVTIVRDITEQRNAEEHLRQLERERAEIEKLAATGRMAARVAHEINNPLAGIKNSFQLIKGSVPREHKYYDYVGLIDREIDRISRIVRGMIDLHRPIEISPRKFQIRDTIREVAELLEPGLREHEVSIRMEGIPADLAVMMHEDYLRQILHNVLKNAVEASPQKSVVKVSATKDDKMLTITISDQGSGIPKEETSRIFEPFFTTKSSLESGGLGLGLAISRGLVDVMGGSLDFESSAEQGTIFRIVLPVDKKEKGRIK